MLDKKIMTEDYYISAKRESTYSNNINYLKVHNAKNFDENNYSTNSKLEIIELINKSYYFMTIFKKNGKWIKGEKVRVVANSCLRTDSNEIKEDNLGELPSF